jgi:hypothetical protein
MAADKPMLPPSGQGLFCADAKWLANAPKTLASVLKKYGNCSLLHTPFCWHFL